MHLRREVLVEPEPSMGPEPWVHHEPSYVRAEHSRRSETSHVNSEPSVRPARSRASSAASADDLLVDLEPELLR